MLMLLLFSASQVDINGSSLSFSRYSSPADDSVSARLTEPSPLGLSAIGLRAKAASTLGEKIDDKSTGFAPLLQLLAAAFTRLLSGLSSWRRQRWRRQRPKRRLLASRFFFESNQSVEFKSLSSLFFVGLLFSIRRSYHHPLIGCSINKAQHR